MTPYRGDSATSKSGATRPRSTGDASWVLVLAVAPILVHGVEFPAGSGNVIAWVIAALVSLTVVVYTVFLFLVTMTHMKPQALRDQQHRSPGIFCAENFDDAGQHVHRKFRRACMLLAFVFAMNGIVAIVFPL